MRRQRYNGYAERRFLVVLLLISALAVLSLFLDSGLSSNDRVSFRARKLDPMEDEEAERVRKETCHAPIIGLIIIT